MSCTPKQRRKAAAKWKRAINPYAKIVVDLDLQLTAMVSDLSNRRLTTLEAAIKKPTESNCWWGTYRTAQMLKSIVRQECLLRRARGWMK